eukprot:scpid33327/ scgid11337/ 
MEDSTALVSAVSSAVQGLLGPLEDRLSALEASLQSRRTGPADSSAPTPGTSASMSGEADPTDSSSGQVPSNEVVDEPKHASVTPEIAEFLEKEFRVGLKTKDRKEILDRFPRPNTEVAVTPKMDSELLEFPGLASSYKKGVDTNLFSVQSSVLDCLGPLTELWMEAQRALDADSGLDPQAVLELIPVALRLLGNAHHKLSSQRRHAFLEHLDKGLTGMADAPYLQAGTALFGPEFLAQMQGKADSQKALADVLRRYRDARGGTKPRSHSASTSAATGGGQFFRRSGTGKYGGSSHSSPMSRGGASSQSSSHRKGSRS